MASPFNQLTKKAQEAIQKAHDNAGTRGHTTVEATHLLLALVSQEDGVVPLILETLDVDVQELESELSDMLDNAGDEKEDFLTGERSSFMQLFPSQEFSRILESALSIARKMQATYIATEHLFLGIVSNPGTARHILKDYGITLQEVMTALKKLNIDKNETNKKQGVRFLEKYTRNLTKLAADGDLDPVIGRDVEMSRSIQILSRRTKNNPIFIGEAGTGKTALAEGLAQRIVKKEVPESMQQKQLLQLDLGQLVAGTKFRGEFEERLKSLQKELEAAPDAYILFIDEIHTLVGAGSAEGSMDASNLLKPALARGKIKVIGATTLKEYQKYIESDSALTRRFQPIFISEPSIEDGIAILRGLKKKYETFHGVRITDESIVSAVTLSSRYLTDRFLPDKAIDLIDEAAASLRVSLENKPQKLEEAQRKIMRLEIEKEALQAELQSKRDKKTSMRLKEIEKEIANVNEGTKTLEARWNNEKQMLIEMKRFQKQIESHKAEAEMAEAEADFSRTAEIRYNLIPQIEKQYKTIEEKLKKIQQSRRLLKEEVHEEDIAHIVSRWTGVPVAKMLEGEMKKLAKMDQELKKRIIGQDEAVDLITNAIRRSRTGISDPSKPAGSFMFLGPTGVGKTELTHQLADFLFDSREALIRVDMSEFMEPHSISKLLGSPPGYVGHDEAGKLTEAVRHRPYSIVLFDEIEKAHPDVLNVLLQVLDAGKLTDSKGRIVNFKNTVVILTSNVGSEILVSMGRGIGFSVEEKSKQESSYEQVKESVMTELTKKFKPEFLNRLDEIVVFKPLEQKTIKSIVNNHIEDVKKRLEEKEIMIEFSKKAISKLAQDAYSPEYGARPLKRKIQTDILNPIATCIVNKEVEKGATIDVDIDKNGAYSFSSNSKKKKKHTAAAA